MIDHIYHLYPIKLAMIENYGAIFSFATQWIIDPGRVNIGGVYADHAHVCTNLSRGHYYKCNGNTALNHTAMVQKDLTLQATELQISTAASNINVSAPKTYLAYTNAMLNRHLLEQKQPSLSSDRYVSLQKRTTEQRKQTLLQLVQELLHCGSSSRTPVFVIGDGTFDGNVHQHIIDALAQVATVILVDESLTSLMCHNCQNVECRMQE